MKDRAVKLKKQISRKDLKDKEEPLSRALKTRFKMFWFSTTVNLH